MASILVQAVQIDSLRSKLSGVKSKSADIAANVAKVKGNLDWQVASSSGIDARLTSLQKRVQAQAEKMTQYAGFLSTVNSQFGAKDGELRNKAKDIIYRLGQVTAAMAALARDQIMSSHKTDEKLVRIAAAGALIGAQPINRSPFAQLKDIINRLIKLSKILKEFDSINFNDLSKKELEALRKKFMEDIKEYERNGTYPPVINDRIAELDKQIRLVNVLDGKVSDKSWNDLQKLQKELEKMKADYIDDAAAYEKILKRIAEVEQRIAGIDNGTIYTKNAQFDGSIYNQKSSDYDDLGGMAGSGCAVTAAAYAMTALGIPMTPRDVYKNNGGTHMYWENAVKAKENNVKKEDIVTYGSKKIDNKVLADAVIAANKDPNSSPVILQVDPKPVKINGVTYDSSSHYLVVKNVVRDDAGNITGFLVHETSGGVEKVIKLSDYDNAMSLFKYTKT